MNKLNCFKAYDIRGKFPEELDENLAYKIGIAYAELMKPKKIIVGYDVRLESPLIAKAVINGLTSLGVDIIDIGICGTEEVYFHSFNMEKNGISGGVMVTASHNPKGYNGLKMVKKGSRPMNGDDDLLKIHDHIIAGNFPSASSPAGKVIKQEDKSAYISHLLSYIDIQKIKPLKIVVNPGNGPAGAIIKLLEKYLPCEFIYINEEPDGNFPNGVPNPMIVENRKTTSDAVIKHQADFGVAWDGDFDRCFLFDEKGTFIEGYYIIGLLATSLLAKHHGEKIIYDPRLTWNTLDIVKKMGGKAIQSKSGHSFIKAKMRAEDAIFGGEMSAHYYFKDFAYCDSGMVPWLLFLELLSLSSQKLSKLVEQNVNAYPCSGEINYKINDPKQVLHAVEEYFKKQNANIDHIDGLSIEFSNWRFNLRGSNTEPLIRLNLETRGKNISIPEKLKEIESVIRNNL